MIDLIKSLIQKECDKAKSDIATKVSAEMNDLIKASAGLVSDKTGIVKSYIMRKINEMK